MPVVTNPVTKIRTRENMRWTNRKMQEIESLWGAGYKVEEIATLTGYSLHSLKGKIREDRDRFPRRYTALANNLSNVDLHLKIPRRLREELDRKARELKLKRNVLVRKILYEAFIDE